jgi:CheY-like chemotaxis protein
MRREPGGARSSAPGRRRDGGILNDPATAPLRGVRVLLVEDHDDIREALETYLTLSGGIVLTASSALDALPQVVMCDVVVTDLAMSGRDGRWLADEVARSPRPVPVIALTAYSEDYNLSQAPFARVLTKPIDVTRLAQELLAVLGRNSTPA